MRIGVDIDGVLADFNSSFIKVQVAVAGRDLFPPRPFDIPCWNYPGFYGYSDAEFTAAWSAVRANPRFWRDLPTYPWTTSFLLRAVQAIYDGHDFYFVTARMSDVTSPKQQTEDWFYTQHFRLRPTVLVTGDKAAVCQALELDLYIDDKFENAEAVRHTNTVSLLLNQPWNAAHSFNGTRVDSPLELFSHIQ